MNTFTHFIKPMRRHRILILAVLGLFVMATFTKGVYHWLFKPDSAAQSGMAVQTVQIKEVAMASTIDTLGTLSAVQEVKIKATTPGRVEKLLVEPGSWVEPGTLLAKIIGSPEVRAPFSGFLTDWQIKEGDYVSTGLELIELVNINKLSLTYRVPEYFAPKLKIGQIVEIEVPAFPDKNFKGEVKYISPTVDKKSFTILIRAEINNLEMPANEVVTASETITANETVKKQKNKTVSNDLLKPGMSAHVHHILNLNPNAKVIPESCLTATMEGYDILIIRDGVLKRQSVTVGGRNNGRVEILTGIAEKDSIVMTQNFMTQEGSKAIPKDWIGEW
jgi:multidrug efflux pump subunit AcrA (membrane-fusion protein)